MITPKLIKQAQHLVADNSAAILTAVGVVGTITTAVLAGKASFSAALEISREQASQDAREDGRLATLTTPEKVKLVAPLYIPAVASGASTVAAIIFAHRINATKSAALAAAYGLSEKAFNEYRDKVEEKLGIKKETELRDEIAQDTITANPPTQQIIIASGKVRCYENTMGRYFESTYEDIQRAENRVNAEILDAGYCSLSFFYDEFALPTTDYSDNVGWNQSNVCDVKISTTLSEDQKPCILVNFRNNPFPDYKKVY